MDTYLERITSSTNPLTLFLRINLGTQIRLRFITASSFKFIHFQKRKYHPKQKMFNSMMGLAEERLNEKRQATSRKGCMRGKGGPENATCMYKGVRQRTWGKWVAEIREANNGARLWLGTFDTSYEAAMAYDAAARKLHGPYAKLNLPQLAATARFPPSSGSFSIKYPENQGLFVNYYLSGVNIATETEAETLLYENMLCENMLCENMLCENMLCENNSDLPMNEKPEEMIKIDFSENLHVDLPDFDDSLMWKEATETMDYQALVDPGIFGCDFDDDNFWNQIKFPWE